MREMSTSATITTMPPMIQGARFALCCVCAFLLKSSCAVFMPSSQVSANGAALRETSCMANVARPAFVPVLMLNVTHRGGVLLDARRLWR